MRGCGVSAGDGPHGQHLTSSPLIRVARITLLLLSVPFFPLQSSAREHP
jgi:hypothetical protein